MTAIQAAQKAANSQFDTYLDSTRSTATSSVPPAVERTAQRGIFCGGRQTSDCCLWPRQHYAPRVFGLRAVSTRLITDLSPPGSGRAFPPRPGGRGRKGTQVDQGKHREYSASIFCPRHAGP